MHDGKVIGNIDEIIRQMKYNFELYNMKSLDEAIFILSPIMYYSLLEVPELGWHITFFDAAPGVIDGHLFGVDFKIDKKACGIYLMDKKDYFNYCNKNKVEMEAEE